MPDLQARSGNEYVSVGDNAKLQCLHQVIASKHAAMMNAQRKLAETVKGVRVTSD